MKIKYGESPLSLIYRNDKKLEELSNLMAYIDSRTRLIAQSKRIAMMLDKDGRTATEIKHHR